MAHTLNNWTRMPPISEQLQYPGIETADFSVARFLLAPGRAYEASVKMFEPYTEIREPNEVARAAGRNLLAGSLQKKRRCTVYVNNRLEGCAPMTIAAILKDLRIPRRAIEVRPTDGGWMVYESDGLRPCYERKEYAISYARFLGNSVKRNVQVLDEAGNVVEDLGLPFSNQP